MALSTISMTIENNPYNGSIEFKSRAIKSSLGNIRYFLAYRKRSNSSESYAKVYEKQITSISELTFEADDFTAACNTYYDYSIELANSNASNRTIIESGTFSNIHSFFEGIILTNNEEGVDFKCCVAHLNCNTSYTRNVVVNYVRTLSGRTPYRVSNGNLNYATGQSSGLFLPLDENRQPTVDLSGLYTTKVIDFLTDGNNKILKTNSGNVWYVSIDSAVEVASNDNYAGYDMVSFNWTEVDDLADIYAGNIISQRKTVVPTTSSQVVVPDEGYDYLSQVTVTPIPYEESTASGGGKVVDIA